MSAIATLGAPSEQEIRDQVERAARSMLDGIVDVWIQAEAALWDVHDLRESELARIGQLADPAYARLRERLLPVLVDELTAVGVAFTAEYPEAPRREPVE